MAMSNEAPQGQAARAALGETRRLVVKIGSRSLMADGTKRYESLARQLSGATRCWCRAARWPWAACASA